MRESLACEPQWASVDACVTLSWRPCQRAFPQQMHMQMRHAFTCIRSAVDHDSVPTGKLQFLRHVARDQKQFSEQRSVRIGRFRKTGNRLLRHDQDMHWRLGINVVKRNRLLIFPNDFSRDLAGNNFFENRHEP